MKIDRIFVLFLVILLPLTGCIDAVGEVDADSEEEISDFESSLQTIYITIEPENLECGRYSSCYWEKIGEFNSYQNSGIEIISFSTLIQGNYTLDGNSYTPITASGVTPTILSTCSSGQLWNTTVRQNYDFVLDSFLPTVGDDCVHEIYLGGSLKDPGQRDSASVDISSIQVSFTWKSHLVDIFV